MQITVQRITTGRWQQNCYIVADRIGCAVIIDPGDDSKSIIALIEEAGTLPLAILCTHGHHDHIGAVSPLRTRYKVPFYLHSKDQIILRGANLYRTLFDKSPPIEIPTVDKWLDENALLNFSKLSLRVLHTPGHTPGGVSFLLAGRLFAGDTILKGQIGRVDLPGGDRVALALALRMIVELPSTTQIYPGHGETTDLALELASNAELLEVVS